MSGGNTEKGEHWFNTGETERYHDFMFTATGGFRLLTGTPNIEDIAQSLGKQCRFNGHTNQFYSVAEHSFNVAYVLRERNFGIDIQLAGLLHDAGEAYTGDITVPVGLTVNVESIRDLERSILRRVFTVAGLEPELSQHPAVHQADKDMGRLEIKRLINNSFGMISFEDLPVIPIRCIGWREASSLFRNHYNYLRRAQ